MKTEQVHPTKQSLIDSMVELLDTHAGEKVLVDELLSYSSISRGSLYHHFEDFGDLVEAAQAKQFSRYVDATSENMAELIKTIKSVDELRNALMAITRRSQSDDLAKSRALRARILGEAESNPRLRAMLQVEVDRLTDNLEKIVSEAVSLGWFKSNFAPRTIAMFIQAYSLGKILNDFAGNKVSEDDWAKLIDGVIEKLFINA